MLLAAKTAQEIARTALGADTESEGKVDPKVVFRWANTPDEAGLVIEKKDDTK